MTVPTTNPVPSKDPHDLRFNAEKLDEFVNSEGATFADRLGNNKPTLAGLTEEFPQAAANAAAAASSASAAGAAAVAAALSKDASFALGPKYVDEPTGRAAVADGAVFLVVGSGEAAAYEYRRIDSATSTLLNVYPSIEAYYSLRGPIDHYRATHLYRDCYAGEGFVDARGHFVLRLDTVTWRGTVAPFGAVRPVGNVNLAAVQDWDGRVYDAAQRASGALPSFVVRSSVPIELLGVGGQSNSGAPAPYLVGAYRGAAFPGHVLQFSGGGKAAVGTSAQSASLLVDLEPAVDSDPTNNYLATLVGHAVEGAGYRSPIRQSPGFFVHTAWTGGQPIAHFQEGGSYWWDNALQAREQAAAVAALYGRTLVERWFVWVQGESGAYGRTTYATALNTLIDTFRPAARDAIGQEDLARFAIVQTNVGDQPDAEPGISQMESVNLAQWDVARTRFADGVRLIGPMYQCPITMDSNDNIHTNLLGRLMLAEMIADAYAQENRDGVQWKPLAPISAVRVGAVVTLTLEVPPNATMELETDWVAAIANKGLAFKDSNGVTAISSVVVTSANTAAITLASVPTGTDPVVQYAVGAARDAAHDGWSSGRGQLRARTNRRSYFHSIGYAVPEFISHYCVKFQIEVTA